MNNLLKAILAVVAALALGYGFGFYAAPEKVRVEERIVEKEKVVKEEKKKITEKFDKDTGKVIEKVEETETKDTSTNTTKTDKVEEKSKDKKMYAVKAGVVVPVTKLDQPSYRVGAEMRLPILNSWLGLEGDIKTSAPTIAAYLRVEF